MAKADTNLLVPYLPTNPSQMQSRKRSIVGDEEGGAGFDSLEEKIDEIIGNVDTMDNTRAETLRGMIAENAKNTIAGNIDGVVGSLSPEVDEIKEIGSQKLDGLANLPNLTPDILSGAKDAWRQKVEERYNSCADWFAGTIATHVGDQLYRCDGELWRISDVTNNFVTGITDSAIDTAKEFILSNVTFDDSGGGGEDDESGKPSAEELKKQFEKQLSESFEQLVTQLQDAVTDTVADKIDEQISYITSALDANIQDVFCKAEEKLQPIQDTFDQVNEYANMVGIDLSELSPTGNLNKLQGSITGGLGDLSDNLKGIQRGGLHDLKDSIFGRNKAATDRILSNRESIGCGGWGSSSGVDPMAPEQDEEDDSGFGSGNAGNVEDRGKSSPRKDSPSEPKPVNYNNEPPKEQKVESDPRRDKCQEIVLWEATDNKYVLVRDGKGNYILFDETQDNVRLQHNCGSFIELRCNGDIMIQASGKVYINSSSASNVERF